jgi:uncharacterized tellurite resistance protein B-like protein
MPLKEPSRAAAPPVRPDTSGPARVRDRIGVITDLLLGAAHADRNFDRSEREAVRRLLRDLLLTDELPANLEQRIESFDPSSFDVRAAARDFASDPPMNKRRLVELVGQLCEVDGVYHLDEDSYIRDLAAALGLEPSEYGDLVLDYEVEELRDSLAEIRITPVDEFPTPADEFTPS